MKARQWGSREDRGAVMGKGTVALVVGLFASQTLGGSGVFLVQSQPSVRSFLLFCSHPEI